MITSIISKIQNVILDFFHLSLKNGINPIKILDREFCSAYRQFEDLPISEIKVVIDVGAHEGLFSRRITKIMSVDNIILIEPLRKQAELLKNLNLPKSKVYNFALSDIDELGVFYVNQCLQASSILPINPIIASQDNIEKISEEKKINVSLRRLDNLLNEIGVDTIDLLKIDTQGAELKILRGCGSKISNIRFIQIELLFEEYYKGAALFGEINQFLYLNGFVLHRLFDFSKAKDGHLLYCDGWYVNSNFIRKIPN